MLCSFTNCVSGRQVDDVLLAPREERTTVRIFNAGTQMRCGSAETTSGRPIPNGGFNVAVIAHDGAFDCEDARQILHRQSSSRSIPA